MSRFLAAPRFPAVNVNSHEEAISLGRAHVRETVAPTEMDPVAHCCVAKGVIARSALFRIIRDGIRIYPPQGQTVGLDVLNKDVSELEVDEVGEGFWCSLHVSGFKGLRAGDVVEAYRVAQE